MIVRHVFELWDLWTEIESLDNAVAAQVQIEMLLEIAGLVDRAAPWLLYRGFFDLSGAASKFAPKARALAKSLCGLLPERDRNVMDARRLRLADVGVPQPLASRVAGLEYLVAALDIAELAENSGQALDRTARVYYGVGARVALDELRAAARRVPAETPWQKQAVEAMIDDFFALQASLARHILVGEYGTKPDPLAAWSATSTTAFSPADQLIREVRAAATPDLAMLILAGRQLRHVLD